MSYMKEALYDEEQRKARLQDISDELARLSDFPGWQDHICFLLDLVKQQEKELEMLKNENRSIRYNNDPYSPKFDPFTPGNIRRRKAEQLLANQERREVAELEDRQMLYFQNKELNRLGAEIAALKAEIAAKDAALAFYADELLWKTSELRNEARIPIGIDALALDGGARARAALTQPPTATPE